MVGIKMVSHNKGSKSYSSSADAEAYKRLFDRIEEEYEVDEIDSSTIKKCMRHSNISDQIVLSRDLYNRALSSKSIEELRELKNQLSSLVVYKNKVSEKIDERIEELNIKIKEEIIASAIARTNEFALSRRISLSEKTKGGVYQKWGRSRRPAVVIFGDGRIKAWRYILT